MLKRFNTSNLFCCTIVKVIFVLSCFLDLTALIQMDLVLTTKNPSMMIFPQDTYMLA